MFVTLVPEVFQETCVFAGLSLVTSVVEPAGKLEVDQFKVELQVEAPLAIVQLVQEMVPEGGFTTFTVRFCDVGVEDTLAPLVALVPEALTEMVFGPAVVVFGAVTEKLPVTGPVTPTLSLVLTTLVTTNPVSPTGALKFVDPSVIFVFVAVTLTFCALPPFVTVIVFIGERSSWEVG